MKSRRWDNPASRDHLDQIPVYAREMATNALTDFFASVRDGEAVEVAAVQAGIDTKDLPDVEVALLVAGMLMLAHAGQKEAL